TPQLVGAPDQRHVGRMLEVGLADDAALPRRRSARVRRGEAVESEDESAAAREVAGRGASHRAEAGDDDVVAGHSIGAGRWGAAVGTISPAGAAAGAPSNTARAAQPA